MKKFLHFSPRLGEDNCVSEITKSNYFTEISFYQNIVGGGVT